MAIASDGLLAHSSNAVIAPGENYRFDVRELGGRMPKNDRIRRLVPLFETGRFYLPEETSRSAWCVDYEGRRFNVVSALINDEFCDFPIARS